MELNLTPLENVVRTLKEALDVYAENSSAMVRDALVKRFEYTYELAFKSVARFIKAALASSEVSEDSLTFSEIIRKACDYGVVRAEIAQWRVFKEKRNLTAHTYNEDNATAVVAIIPAFLEEAEYILKKLFAKKDSV